MITFISGGYAIKVEWKAAVCLTIQFEIEALKIEISRILQNIFYKFQLITKKQIEELANFKYLRIRENKCKTREASQSQISDLF